MSDLETTVAAIEVKVRRLVNANSGLSAKVKELQCKCDELQKALDNQHNINNNLEEKNKLLILGNSLANKNDATEVKLKINQLIRSIDKSLLLLSKTK